MGDSGIRKLEGIVLLGQGKTKALPTLASKRGEGRRGNFFESKSISIANEKVILSGLLGLGLMRSC